MRLSAGGEPRAAGRGSAPAAHSYMAAIPRDSSRGILLDERVGGRVLLIRRHADLGFAGGAWVFPGGKLEVPDTSAETVRRLGLAAVPIELAALIVCACRETFEEIGVV